MYGAWTKDLAAEDVAILVRLLLKGDKAAALEPSMVMLQEVLEHHPEAIEKVEPLVWDILESTPPNASVMAEWRWGELSYNFAHRNPQRMVRLIIRQYSSPGFIPATDERHQALHMATEADPVGAWNIVGDAFLHAGDASYNLLTALRGWYGELIPIEHLVSWARAHEPDGPRIVARLISPTPGQLSQRARALVLAFPGNEEVWSGLLANVVTGAWMGPISGKMERDLAVVKQWEGDPDPAFRSWVRGLVEAMEKNLRAQRTREEEGYL